jgi:EmrB/QacA subfamily drug resistance transporter
MLLAATNSGTLIIALPELERALHTSLLSLVWVILVYMISSTVLVLTAGRFSDLFGRKKAYVAGFVLFTAASFGAGFAASGNELIAWRLLQGVAGALIFANSSAIVTDAFPRKELGLAMGTNTMVAAVGLVIGPVLGGALVKVAWQWVFWFNVPIGLLGTAWAALVLRDLARKDTDRGLDLPGTGLYLLGLSGLVFALSKGGLDGWTNSWVLAGFAFAAICLPAFVVVERHHRAPMLDLSIFRDRLFAAASGAALINGLSRFALMFLLVFYFQGPQELDPVAAGVRLAPMAIGMLVAAPIAGWLADRKGSRGLSALGMLITAIALAGMTTLDASTPYWQTAFWLALVGIGSGAFNSPNTAAMMGVVPQNRRGVAAGARTMLQNTGAVISISFVLAIVTAGIPKTALFKIFSGITSGLPERQVDTFLANMHLALWTLAGVSLLGMVVSLLRPSHATHEDELVVLEEATA